MNPENILNNARAKKLLLVDILFLAGDFLITYLMFRLWFWLFSNKIVITILLVITLIGLIKQIWKSVGNITDHWKLYTTSKKLTK